ncbi:UDP-glycosyltransferase 74G1-like [Silene latifolia]|uniref:UDP-glycosyltransferase 74G1-like n=1 Tax=Silene latifolia TaxID=37657 RepID=UPI003D771CF8
MANVEQTQKAHVLVVPYPAQGHINPMLQFSKRLASKGIKTTLSPTIYLAKSMHSNTIPTHYGPPIQIRPISDGYDEGGFGQAESTGVYLDSLRDSGSRTLAELISKLNEEGDPVQAVIYDGFTSWALDVAKRAGLVTAIFFTQSCSINSVYYHVQRGLIQLPLSGTVSVPGVPELQPWEAPSYMHKYGSYPYWFDVIKSQFGNIDQADWVLCNIFYEMEKEAVDWMSELWKVRTIGPTVPSYYLDKRLENDKDYSMQLIQPDIALCTNWLDTKPKGSVIYVSFGSMAELTDEQFDELSQGLQECGQSFLWVVRQSEQSKLPKDFVTKTGDKGLVVSWSSQLEVLAHVAIGCFLTHCGFNSVLEALCLGVPVVGVPQWTDQPTNAKFVEDVWKIGLRVKVDEEGIARKEEVVECIREVMEGEKSVEIRKNADLWKKVAREAIDDGGSSDKNIDEFVASLV